MVNQIVTRTIQRIVPLFLTVALAGCEVQPTSVPNSVPVKGRLLQAGEPLVVKGREIGTGMVQLTFLSVTSAATDQPFSAVADEAGNFDLPGGMPAGKYRVVVRQWEPYPQTDKLQGRFGEENSPLVVEVDGKTPLEIDLANAPAETQQQ